MGILTQAVVTGTEIINPSFTIRDNIIDLGQNNRFLQGQGNNDNRDRQTQEVTVQAAGIISGIEWLFTTIFSVGINIVKLDL